MNSAGKYYKNTPYQIVYGFYGYAKPKYGVFRLDIWQKCFDTKKQAVEFVNNAMQSGGKQ